MLCTYREEAEIVVLKHMVFEVVTVLHDISGKIKNIRLNISYLGINSILNTFVSLGVRSFSLCPPIIIAYIALHAISVLYDISPNANDTLDKKVTLKPIGLSAVPPFAIVTLPSAKLALRASADSPCSDLTFVWPPTAMQGSQVLE